MRRFRRSPGSTKRRALLLLGVPVAACFGVMAIFQLSPGVPPALTSRQYDIGLATTKVFVDSPMSQISNVGAETAEIGSANDIRGLMTRAQLLASLMSTGPLKERISARSGVPSERLSVLAPTGFGPPGSESGGNGGDRKMGVLDLSVDERLPVINLNARAPDARTAERIAGAGVHVLREHVEASAQSGNVPVSDRIVVSPIAPLSSETVVVGPRKLYGVAAFLVVLTVWVSTIVMLPRLVQYWRSLDAGGAAGAPPPASPTA